MTWLLFVFILETGYLPNAHVVMYETGKYDIDHSGSFYTDLNFELIFAEHLFINGGVKTYIWKSTTSTYTFSPDSSEYLFSVGLRFSGIEIGFRHYCIHPTVPWYTDNKKLQKIWEGAYEEFYVSIKGEIALF